MLEIGSYTLFYSFSNQKSCGHIKKYDNDNTNFFLKIFIFHLKPNDLIEISKIETYKNKNPYTYLVNIKNLFLSNPQKRVLPNYLSECLTLFLL